MSRGKVDIFPKKCIMYMKAMSSATADRNKTALCLHISRFISGSCDRANARELVNRRFASLHCEIERHAMFALRRNREEK